MVPAPLLCKLEAIPGRTELFNNRKRSVENDLQRHQVPTLSNGKEIFLSCRPLSTTIFGLEGIAHWQTCSMDIIATRIRVRDISPTRNIVCGCRLDFGETADGVLDEFPNAELFRVTAEMATDSTVADEEMNRDERKRLTVQS